MPTILETIREYEQDVLGMIAEQWGFDVDFIGKEISADEIAARMQNKVAAGDMLEALSESEKEAFRALYKHQGKIKWDGFARKYGQIREMGAIPRKRERPDRNPVSAAEHLFYFGMLGRAFFKDKNGLEEYAYLPDEWIEKFPFPGSRNDKQIGLPVQSGKSIRVCKWSDGIVQHATTLLAELRKSNELPPRFLKNPEAPVSFLHAILIESKMIGENNRLDTEKIRAFLKLSQPQAFLFLFQLYRDSVEINELTYFDDLEIEGGWKNNPKQFRESILSLLGNMPAQEWVRLEDLISWVHANQPDLLRSAGEYDALLIKNTVSGEYLRGFENWNSVEGIFIRFWISGPAVWMGLVETGVPYKEPENIYLRVSSHAETLLAGDVPLYDASTKKIFYIEKSGRIVIQRSFPLDIRYQIARFCDLIQADAQKYIYQVTPGSLAGLTKQGLKPSQLIKLLQKYGRKPVPANIIVAVQRWQKNKIEAEIQEACLLEVQAGGIIEKLINSPVSSYILAQINETTIKITREGIPFIRSALLELGIFSDIGSDI
jgi:hypothetical protein